MIEANKFFGPQKLSLLLKLDKFESCDIKNLLEYFERPTNHVQGLENAVLDCKTVKKN